MQREVSLEEYYLLKPEDRGMYLDQVVHDLWSWEPSIRSNIEEVLRFGINSYYKNSTECAVELLTTLQSLELVQAIRRHFTTFAKKRSDEITIQSICILLEALYKNPYIDIEKRFDTLKYYTNNPRYAHDIGVDKVLADGLEFILFEIQDVLHDVHQTLVTLQSDKLIHDYVKGILEKLTWLRPI